VSGLAGCQQELWPVLLLKASRCTIICTEYTEQSRSRLLLAIQPVARARPTGIGKGRSDPLSAAGSAVRTSVVEIGASGNRIKSALSRSGFINVHLRVGRLGSLAQEPRIHHVEVTQGQWPLVTALNTAAV
jgi:hypothetical protein